MYFHGNLEIFAKDFLDVSGNIVYCKNEGIRHGGFPVLCPACATKRGINFPKEVVRARQTATGAFKKDSKHETGKATPK